MNPAGTLERTLRIAVAEDQPDMRAFYQAALPMMGHEIVGTANDGIELVSLYERTKPDLVIADIAMPRMDGIAAADRICQIEPVAIVLVSAHYDKQLIQRAQLEYVMAYLVKPITEVDLATAISMAMMRFEQFELLRDEAHTARQAMNDRRIIEQAKAAIMQASGLSEAEAFRRLQKLSWQQKRRLVKVAQQIVATSGPRRSGMGESPTASGLQGAPLSAQEREVVQLVALGLANKEIAERLSLDPEAVEKSRSTGMEKLALRGRAELVRYAEEQKWF